MGTYINKGNDGFSSVCNSNYVDKSLLIEQVNSVLLTESRYMCVTRARRFGKSVAVKMLNAYYDKSCNSSDLFKDLKISQSEQYQQHLNHYPVIYLDITDFVTKFGIDANIVEKIKQDVYSELISLYPNVTLHPGHDLMDLLIAIVEETGERFICLIDEWDALCREGYEKQVDLYVDFLRRLFKGSKSESVFACVYMTGILPIKRYNTQSALNNFEEFTMLSPARLAPYFGFSESEVQALCTKAGMDIATMKQWYDGYEIGDELSMYNPYAVMRAISRAHYENYWASTNTFDSLKQYLIMNYEGLKDDVVKLLADVPVEINTLRFSNDMHKIGSKDDVLTLLCHLGYLSFSWKTKQAKIPNYEIRQEFETAIADSSWSEVIRALQQSEDFLHNILNFDSDAVAQAVSIVHQENTSILKYNNENSLACVLSLALYTARNRYTIIRELPSGLGYADLVLLPHRNVDSPAIVVELKYNHSANSAITQIKRQEYVGSLQHYSGEILLVGIDYNKKSKRHSCVIEMWQKKQLSKTTEKNQKNYGKESSKTTNKKTTEKTADKILRLITATPTISYQTLSTACGLSTNGVYYHTKKLREAGLIQRLGGKKNGYWEVVKH